MSDTIDTPKARFDDYSLLDRYTRQTGRVFLTGTQALVRILLDQRDRDIADGINSAGFVSGYRGSPLGGVDLELWRAQKFLKQRHIEFLPAVNEDLAATAVLGSQQVESHPQREVDGVFGLWYGKGPGVDRSGDALKHGNAYGSSPHGGVLVVAGDDHGCVSSSMPHQSDVAFMAWFVPTLNPADVAEYLAFGEYGYALSRFSGMWTGFKAISETVESCASVDLPARRVFARPDFSMPPGGLHYRWPDLPGPQIEQRLEHKKNAVLAFAKANPIDRRIYDIPEATYGIVTTGKGHLDLMEALQLLGLDGSFVGSTRPAHGDQCVFHFQLRLLPELRLDDLALAEQDLIARHIGLCDPIPQRQSKVQANSVGGIFARGQLLQRIAVAADQRRLDGRHQRIQLRGQRAVLSHAHHV